MPNFCERRCLPQAFFRGIWRSPENVGSAMVTGDAGAASTAAAPCHPGTAFMRHGLAGLPAAPAPSPSVLASADAEKLRGFMSKVQKWGFGSAAELTDRWSHKKSQKDLYSAVTVYIHGPPTWLSSYQSRARKPPPSSLRYTETETKTLFYLHCPKSPMTPVLLLGTGTAQPEQHLTGGLFRVKHNSSSAFTSA